MTEIRTASRLTADEVTAMLRLVQLATEEDGVAPLSEHVMLHLRYGGDRQAKNLWICRGNEIAAYAHLDPTDLVEGPSAELVVHPSHRRQHLGLALTSALIEQAESGTAPAGTGPPGSGGPGQLRLWAHGDQPPASRLAAVAGFDPISALWQMRRARPPRLGRPQFAGGVTLRTFQVGQDEDAWVALNASAFSRHPEQGAWTRADLDVREREPWFEPTGFFLAERDGRLVGFHWTKIHGRDGQESGHSHEAMGEVYVVGVDPGERGTGLGRALTLAGLRYLRSRGLFQVMLYVDESNTAAIRLYESLGFTHWDTDVMFGRRLGG